MKGFFKGSATALITPFNENGINFDALEKLIEHQIAGGTAAIVILGTTGEPATMSFEEERSVMEFAMKTVAGRTKVIFGCGSNNTTDAVEMAKLAEFIGADGLLAVTPYYNKCTQNGLVAYYQAICEAVSIPVIGLGGISNYRDVIEFMLAGASAVQVGTANFTNPMVMPEILADLEEYMIKNGIDDINDIVGKLIV